MMFFVQLTDAAVSFVLSREGSVLRLHIHTMNMQMSGVRGRSDNSCVKSQLVRSKLSAIVFD